MDRQISHGALNNLSEKALDARARRAAISAGLMACKSRRHLGGVDNYGGFMIVDPNNNTVVAGPKFDMDAREVIAWCAEAP